MLECLTVEPDLCWALTELPVELQHFREGSNKWLQGQPEAAAVCCVDRQTKGSGRAIFRKVECFLGGSRWYQFILPHRYRKPQQVSPMKKAITLVCFHFAVGLLEVIKVPDPPLKTTGS